ncbi:hypothetical protein CAter282_0430 [Collimonas arenae]|uniref:Uncharacterized protein n=2 Tax=Collimonas arenae TaxID=279058 RepID=A0A127PKR1_9BURK|nr:hypothetical protein CAter10_0460 [Collimonas arenae]AMP08246.1 hypothetical protein CAter282_0430 [Collimonas arenae]
MVTPPANATRLLDCKAAADLRFQALYGEPSTTWKIAADWQIVQPFLASAIPQTLLATLQHACLACRLPLVEIAPQFVAAWNRSHSLIRKNAWFGVVDCDLITFAALHQGRLHAVRSIPLAEQAITDPAYLHDHIAREVLRLQIPMPTEMQFYGKKRENWCIPTADQLIYSWLDEGKTATRVAQTPGLALASTGLAGT